MLFNKKSNLVLQFIILIIIAAIMIFVVTAFGVKIFEAIFPSGDKATIKSFDTLYTTIDFKSKSADNYDSSRMTLYLYDDYQILYYEANKVAKCKTNNYQMPDLCVDKKKNCICLLDEHNEDPKDFNKNVIKCYSFDQEFKFAAFDIHDTDSPYCVKRDGLQFHSLIIASRYDVNKNHEIYVWLNNEENRKLDEEYKTVTCPIIAGDVCSGQKSDTLLTGSAWSDQVKAQCNKQTPPVIATEGTCVYSTTLKKCELVCGTGADCSKITSCEDYGGIDSGATSNSFDYFKSGGTSEDYCSNDYCKVSNDKKCKVEKFAHYMCNDKPGTIDSTPGSTCYFPDCGRIMIGTPLSNYVLKYDKTLCSAADLQKIAKDFFSTPYIFITNDKDKKTCDDKIARLATLMKCELRTVDVGVIANKFLMSYKPSAGADCIAFVKYCYEEIYYCQGPNYNYEVSDAKIDPAIIVTDPNNVGNKICISSPDQSTLGEDYKCLIKKDVKLQLTIKNTGDYELKAKLFVNLPPPFVTITGNEVNVGKGVTSTLTASIKSDVPSLGATPILGAECTETICQNNPSLKQKLATNIINILFVDKLVP